ncbi:ATP-dependent OLD family endonuclease [Burkholderia pseudomallei]|uniref:ATP-dependent nuclease n=1 Tax=Burkholderia pseudomallei TaxID=28450 RepID=UPI0005DAC5DC|nr:AAA family ATPase [Burkholderia pseudomallei]CAK1326971.1 ATP-dependent OLD family endonuclease [Burkholderia pseudomallei]CAK1338343.1 ATP-dependent OLD family endonuclease [Burkholderia pseudomallei]
MHVVRVRIRNFRGIAAGDVHLHGHTVFVGDNNTGKSTLLEAIDLVLGPERLNRRPVVDEHDFYAGVYVSLPKREVIPIQVEVVVAGLSEEQQRHFRDHVEWWNTATKAMLAGPPTAGTDAEQVVTALRVFFNGWYDVDEDDFTGDTYYAIPEAPGGDFVRFTTGDKRKCGFLYLRTLRTGARALSLERGSLLDVILRLRETRLKMWEDLLSQLRALPVGEAEEIGELLASVQEAVRHYVPSDWAEEPHMRVSDLTRDMLRRTLTVFMGTGAKRPDGSTYAAPYQHQGTGTINTLVLALLSIIAELKQSVIFAMEEPEIALPPHTQKRIINSLRQRSAQAIFTSHSPYVLEEFEPDQILVLKRVMGVMTGTPATYPPSVKPKAYRTEFRTRFCEALLARYVLVVEGRTEFDALPAAARRLSTLDAMRFKSLENLGVAIVDAQGESNVAPLGAFFRSLGKTVFAVFDKQTPDALKAIIDSVDHAFESATTGFENLVLTGTSEAALRAYAAAAVASGGWPQHLAAKTPTPESSMGDLQSALSSFFGWAKGGGDAGDLLASCADPGDVPAYVRNTLESIKNVIEPPLSVATAADRDGDAAGDSAGDEASADLSAAEEPTLGAYAKFLPHPPKPLA